MMYAPVALFVYNRLSHTQQTIDALLRNTLARETDVIVFSDGPKTQEAAEKVETLRTYLANVRGFKSLTIRASEKNKGLANSLTSGITSVLVDHPTVIVVEDDLVTSPYFLEYMNHFLNVYESDDEVVSIHGYMYPVPEMLPPTFFIRGADCWGWATWRRGWAVYEPDGKKLLAELTDRNLTREFDFDGTYGYTRMLGNQIAGWIDSWAIRWYASAFLRGKLTLYPGKSLVQNIGFDGSGTHVITRKNFDVTLQSARPDMSKIDVKENAVARAAMTRYFRKIHRRTAKGILKAVLRRLGVSKHS